MSPRPIRSVAVLGGGLMGSGIATACALAGLQVMIKEVNQKFLDVSRVDRCLWYCDAELFQHGLLSARTFL